MILVDANLLIYSIDHRAKAWLENALSGETRVGLPWQSLLAYVRIGTNPRIYDRPETMASAWRQVEDWLQAECVWIPVAGPGHRSILAGLLADLGGGPKLIPDAHLAALAMEHGLTLCSADGDFARFRGLRWTNPLAG